MGEDSDPSAETNFRVSNLSSEAVSVGAVRGTTRSSESQNRPGQSRNGRLVSVWSVLTSSALQPRCKTGLCRGSPDVWTSADSPDFTPQHGSWGREVSEPETLILHGCSLQLTFRGIQILPLPLLWLPSEAAHFQKKGLLGVVEGGNLTVQTFHFKTLEPRCTLDLCFPGGARSQPAAQQAPHALGCEHGTVLLRAALS